MNVLQHLTTEDFKITKIGTHNVLCNVLPGLSLIMFYSNSCHFCIELMPMFKKIPSRFPGCTFGIVNVSRNMGMINSAKQTTTSIEYVPLIILYNGGLPIAKYNSEECTESTILQFISSVIQKQQLTQRFVQQPRNVENKEDVSQYIPEFLKDIGIPVCTGKVCYLEYGNAYHGAQTS